MKNTNLVENLYALDKDFQAAFKGVDYNEYLFGFGYVDKWGYPYENEYFGEKDLNGMFQDCCEVNNFHCEASEIAEHISKNCVSGLQYSIKQLYFQLKKCNKMTGVDLLTKHESTMNELLFVTGLKKKTEAQQEGQLDAYIDGSFDKETNRYGWSFVVFDKDDNIVVQQCGVGDSTDAVSSRNVAGELSAAMHAAQWATKNNTKINLYHDYEGVKYWATGDWQAKSPVAKKYKKFIDNFYGSVIVRFIHVKGHSGNMGNKLADKLARQALGK